MAFYNVHTIFYTCVTSGCSYRILGNEVRPTLLVEACVARTTHCDNVGYTSKVKDQCFGSYTATIIRVYTLHMRGSCSPKASQY